MNEERITESPSWNDPRGEVMKTPDEVAAMVRLKACGWGLKRIARELGCSHHTVKHYVAAGGPLAFKAAAASDRSKLAGSRSDFEALAAPYYFRNMIRQELDGSAQNLLGGCGAYLDVDGSRLVTIPYGRSHDTPFLAWIFAESPRRRSRFWSPGGVQSVFPWASINYEGSE